LKTSFDWISAKRGAAMVRYYLDVHDGEELVRDEEGSEFARVDAAVQAAARSAAEIGTSRLARGDTSDVVIEVRDEQGRGVCPVTASMKIARHVSEDQGPNS
jgi:alpha-D-ribose 1-methylphosphonate 5-triphosphate synthase subunit PhnH